MTYIRIEVPSYPVFFTFLGVKVGGSWGVSFEHFHVSMTMLHKGSASGEQKWGACRDGGSWRCELGSLGFNLASDSVAHRSCLMVAIGGSEQHRAII